MSILILCITQSISRSVSPPLIAPPLFHRLLSCHYTLLSFIKGNGITRHQFNSHLPLSLHCIHLLFINIHLSHPPSSSVITHQIQHLFALPRCSLVRKLVLVRHASRGIPSASVHSKMYIIGSICSHAWIEDLSCHAADMRICNALS
jgi:hypothetical protein